MKFFSLVFAVLFCLFSTAYAGDPEFGGQCALGMAEGQKHATDCSVLWVGPDDKIYCFANQTAKQKFLQAPKENLTRAQAFWEDPENLKKLIRRE
ncbi:MAG TPA: hypothetical protein VKD04_08705 [Burkholderiales bacterium]|nr:hypothetical protein [Burkholderiales bacterium]